MGFVAVVVVAVVVVVVLALAGPRWPLRSPWLWAGISAALLLVAPYTIWQFTHDLPQLTVASQGRGWRCGPARRRAGAAARLQRPQRLHQLGPAPLEDVTSVLLLGFDGPAGAVPYFDDCTRPAVVDNGVGLDNGEQGLPVQLRRPTESWQVLWPKLRHYT